MWKGALLLCCSNVPIFSHPGWPATYKITEQCRSNWFKGTFLTYWFKWFKGTFLT